MVDRRVGGETDLSAAETGAESPGGGRKNSARLSRRREKPRLRTVLRTVLKSGLGAENIKNEWQKGEMLQPSEGVH